MLAEVSPEWFAVSDRGPVRSLVSVPAAPAMRRLQKPGRCRWGAARRQISVMNPEGLDGRRETTFLHAGTSDPPRNEFRRRRIHRARALRSGGPRCTSGRARGFEPDANSHARRRRLRSRRGEAPEAGMPGGSCRFRDASGRRLSEILEERRMGADEFLASLFSSTGGATPLCAGGKVAAGGESREASSSGCARRRSPACRRTIRALRPTSSFTRCSTRWVSEKTRRRARRSRARW